MSKFIRVPVGKDTWYVNADLVRSIQPAGDSCSIKFDDLHSLPVKMSADDVVGAIRAATGK